MATAEQIHTSTAPNRTLSRPPPGHYDTPSGSEAHRSQAGGYDRRTEQFQHWRELLIDQLPAGLGDTVLDIGCGTGLCLPLLHDKVGPTGAIICIDASEQVLRVAADRVTETGWSNVQLIAAPAPVADAVFDRVADAVIFCAVHDVLHPPTALGDVFDHLRPGAAVAAIGGKFPAPWLWSLRKWVTGLHAPFITDFTGFEAATAARAAGGSAAAADRPAVSPKAPVQARPPIRPYLVLDVGQRFAIQHRIESIAVVKGEYVCTNDDLVRNAAYRWSPMSADEISAKTGIEQRRYTARDLEEISLEAARAALAHAGREPEEIGAVLFCSCTSSRLIPSASTWLIGQLGMQQTHASVDLVAACAGLAYGLSEAVRLLQEVDRPVLLVCAEKFSDKIGTVRPFRMIFGDGASAIVIGPAPAGDRGDIALLQTYAGGPVTQVDSIIWPNPAFDNNITVYEPDVKALAGRYLAQMIDELTARPDTTGKAGTAWDTVEMVVPHQANKTMVIDLAATSGLAAERLYFNIETMGNTSSASIPIAICDAVAEHVIDRPKWIFAPGFGAGAVAGYAVLRIDPAVVAPTQQPDTATPTTTDRDQPAHAAEVPHASDDIATAFGA